MKPNHIHPLKADQERGSPSLFIVEPKWSNLIREMVELKKEVLPSGHMRFLGDDPPLDCLRYVLLSRPKPLERTRADVATLTSQEQFALRTHEKWKKRFARPRVDWCG